MREFLFSEKGGRLSWKTAIVYTAEKRWQSEIRPTGAVCPAGDFCAFARKCHRFRLSETVAFFMQTTLFGRESGRRTGCRKVSDREDSAKKEVKENGCGQQRRRKPKGQSKNQRHNNGKDTESRGFVRFPNRRAAERPPVRKKRAVFRRGGEIKLCRLPVPTDRANGRCGKSRIVLLI